MPNPHDQLFDHVAGRIAKMTYVVLIKDNGHLTLIADPGLSKPWSTKNKRQGDQVAKECDGMCCTVEEAFRLLKKESPNLERTLVDRIARQAKITASGLVHDKKTNQLLDHNGRPVKNAN